MNCPSNITHDRHNDNTTHLYIGACRNVASEMSKYDGFAALVKTYIIDCCVNRTIVFVVRCRSPVVGTSNSDCRNRFIVKFLNYFS